VDVRAAAGPPGTSVEVRQLFFNLPARRKFLRSEETERAHIQHYLLLAALAFPEVGFTFLHDGRTVWQLAPLPHTPELASRLASLRERLRALYGADLNLLAVDFQGRLQSPPEAETEESPEFREDPAGGGRSPDDGFRVWGFIGAPGVSRSTREDQHLFVNRRPVENRGLNFALLEGYHTALMKGRYPVCCLFVELDPAEVDVNIHPAKREVKFHAERQVRALVTQAVRRTLLAFHTRAGEVGAASGSERPDASPPPAEPRSSSGAGGQASGAEPDVVGRQRDMDFGATRGTAPADLGPPVPRERPPDRAPESQPAPAGLPTTPLDPITTHPVSPAIPVAVPTVAPPPVEPPERDAPEPPVAVPGPVAGPAVAPGPMPLLRVPLRLVGVVGRLYVVLESDRGLVLLDQHAAHERILFEQMLARLEEGPAPSQRLLLPETVEVSPRDAVWLKALVPLLTRLGVGLREFGDRTFLLDGLPPFVRTANARHFVLELVDALKAAGQEVNSLRLGEDVVAKTVCRHAVKANDPLRGRELENLVEDLRRCRMPYTCPHGRPTLIELSYRELEKKFGRAQ
jgi:DNA mismatch repair protein MutL